MARIDVPTLQCDRCGTTTQDTDEMGKYQRLTGLWHGYGSTEQQWDLCPSCWQAFMAFVTVAGEARSEEGISPNRK